MKETMNKQIINEGLDYMDMVYQVEPELSVDEYAAKMGKDSDIVTLAFIVNSEAAGNDLVDWFERGYDWVLDASISEGELSPGKYLVFVEMERRSKTASRIIELLEDLETLTGLSLDDWSIEVEGEAYGADKDKLKEVIAISPHEYREEHEDEDDEDEEVRLKELCSKILHGESEVGDLKKIVLIIDKILPKFGIKIDIDETIDQSKQTPLLLASREGYPDIVKFLIKNNYLILKIFIYRKVLLKFGIQLYIN